MVERNNRVIESGSQCRNFEFIELRGRDAFQAAAEIVAEQSRRTTLKGRQVRPCRSAQRQVLSQRGKPVRAIRGNAQEGIGVGGQKRITADLLISQRAVQEQAMRVLAEC